MKRVPKPFTPPPQTQRPSVRRGGAKAIRRFDQPQGSGHWKGVAIGGMAIAATLVCLQLTKKGPHTETAGGTDLVEAQQTAPKVENEEWSAEEMPDSAEIEASNLLAGRTVSGNDVPPPAIQGGTETPTPSFEDRPAAPKRGLKGDEPLLVLTGLDAGRKETVEVDQKLLKLAIDESDWDGYRNLLARSINASMDKLPRADGLNRFSPIWKEKALYQAFLRWQVLGKFSRVKFSERDGESYPGALLTWLCNKPEAMEEFLLTVKPEDNAQKVLNFLVDAWPNTPDQMDKYFSLALACAVVFDQDVNIPHPIGGGEEGGSQKVLPMQRYMWFINKNEKGQLAAPVNHTPARELVWVVCAPVSTSELEWSLDKMHLSQSHWGNAYGMVEYLMERAVNGLNPYKEYSFSEILKEGGICGDQSYFSANTARAQGIPAMIFGGETDLGPHAWVGMKIKGDEWTTGVGRIGGVSKGETQNPQTGKTITEQEVKLWGDRAHQSPVTTLEVARHMWLADYFGAGEEKSLESDAIHLANQKGPSFTETWAALYSLLKGQTRIEGNPEQPNNLAEWQEFAKSMRREFKDNPRMAELAANAEMDYIFPYGDPNDANRALLRERRRIERDSSEQKDLIAQSLKRQAELIAKRNEPTAKKEISNLYDPALRKYGGSITGFKMMAEDYFGYLKDDQELAHKAARDIELAFKRVVETGTKDWFRAKTESSIYQMICGYYRASGDPARAELLEKRYEVLLRRAERGAL